MNFSEPKQSGLKIWFLTSGRSSPSSRYRVFQYLPHLRADGFRCTVANSFPDKYEYFPLIGWRSSRLLKRLVRRWHLMRVRWSRPDVVVLVTGDADFAHLALQLRRRGIRVEVASTAQTLGSGLKGAANEVIDLVPLFETFDLMSNGDQ